MFSGRPSASNGPSSTWASAGSAIAPRPSEQTVMPSWAPAIISGIWFIAESAHRAGLDVAASGSRAVRREAISANSPPTKTPLPISRTIVTRSLVIGGLRRRRDHAHLLDAVPVDFHHGELPAALLERLAHHRDVAQPGEQEAGQRLVRSLGQREPGLFHQLVLAQ